MKILTQEEFQKRKTSDTIVVLGSGYSINKISPGQWGQIRSVDSIGFNWFCKHTFHPSYFLIREQANTIKRVSKDETSNILVSKINKYNNTCIIIVNIRKTAPTSFNYVKWSSKFHLSGIIVNDIKTSNIKRVRKNIFSYGLIHGRNTMYGVLHLIYYLRYKKIIFAGVDLNNSCYFWLGRKQTRHTIRKKRKNYKSVHPTAKPTMKLLSRYRNITGIEMFNLSRKSLLSKKMPTIETI